MDIARPYEVARVRQLLRQHPVVAILGPRQVGKTTLADAVAHGQDKVTRFDLEDPTDERRLRDAKLTLSPLRGLVIVDEVQRAPELFPLLRVLADRRQLPARFLVLGSAAPQLLKQSSESLAGRIGYHELAGFSLSDVGANRSDRLWLRGGFPRSFLAKSDAASWAWRASFVQTFLERDVPQLGITIGAATLRRFWSMIAHYHGQTWNSSELARSFGVADTTVRRYLDLLCATFVVRTLQPWSENLGKRQVRAPKVYVADTGLLHSLLDIRDRRGLDGHPKLGASFEGFAIDLVIRVLGAQRQECFFWATHAGAELDLLVVRGRQRLGFEIKHTASPELTRSMRSALTDLHLTKLYVVYPGRETFALHENVQAVPVTMLAEVLGEHRAPR